MSSRGGPKSFAKGPVCTIDNSDGCGSGGNSDNSSSGDERVDYWVGWIIW